jgi:hypothetical protein
LSARARTLATGRCSSAVRRPGRLHIARQTGPFCTVQLAVAEGTAVAPNGGSASILPRPSSPLSVMPSLTEFEAGSRPPGPAQCE